MDSTSRRPPGSDSPSQHQHHRLGPFHPIATHFERTLGAGILVVLPIGVTILILKFFFDLLDPILQPLLRYLPGPKEVPGLGVGGLLIVVYLAGLVTAHVVGRRLIGLAHRVMEVTPIVKGIYSTTRTAVELLSSPKGHHYNGVVLVDFPYPGTKSIGLVTSRMETPDGQEMLAVYIPTTPIPSSGFLIIVPPTSVTPTSMSVDDAMKVVISGGILAGRAFQRSGLAVRVRSNSNQ